jgi:hypothetical protein
MSDPTTNFQFDLPANGEVADATPLATALAVIDELLGNTVNQTGNQAVSGIKQFTVSPIVPDPVNPTDAVNLEYVTGLIASGVPDATTSTPGKIQIAGAIAGTGSTATNIVLAANSVGDTQVSALSQSKVTGLTTALAAKEATANKGVAGGYASLDGTGKVPTSQLPSIAINDVTSTASQAAMLALSAVVGDVTIRSDITSGTNTFLLTALPASTLANWVGINNAGAGVSSINGSLTGAVTGIEVTSAKGAASGYAPLDSSSKVPTANLPAFVDLSTTQASIGGAKTFTGSISVPTPTSNAHAATKAYVDAIASVGAGYTQGSIYYVGSMSPYSADATGFADAAGVIQTAINDASAAGGGIVFLKPGTYKISTTLILPQRVTLMGSGMYSTILKLANGVNATVIKNYVSTNTTDANGEFITVKDLMIHGNKANNSAGHGIEFAAFPLYTQTTNDLDFDTHNRLENVMIYNVKQDGFRGTGRSEMRILNCFAYYVDRYGFFGAFDTWYNACTAAHTGSNGFHLEDSSVRIVNCKAFYTGKLTVDGDNGHGFAFRNGQGGLNGANLEAQDCAGNGFAFNNCQRGTFVGLVADSNSSTHVNSSVTPGTYVGFDFYNSSHNTLIGAVSYEREAYGTSYQLNALQVRSNSTNNNIQLTHSAYTFGGATVGTPIKAGSTVTGNYISINAQEGAQTVTAGTSTPDVYSGHRIYIPLTSNTTINNTANEAAHFGAVMEFVFVQDATGSRTVTFGSNYTLNGWTVTSTANSVSSIKFFNTGASNSTKWVRIA